jgi:hypothetical protein
MQKKSISLIPDSSISELLEQRILTSGDLAKVLSFMHLLVGCDPVRRLAISVLLSLLALRKISFQNCYGTFKKVDGTQEGIKSILSFRRDLTSP